MDERTTKSPAGGSNRPASPPAIGRSSAAAARPRSAPASASPAVDDAANIATHHIAARGTVEAAARQVTQALNETLTDERNDVLSVINELEDQLDRYEAQRARAERELTQTRERLEAATARSQELEWQVGALQTRVAALDSLTDENRLLQEETDDAQRRCAQLTERLAASEQESARLGSELKAVEKDAQEFWAIRTERDGLRSDLKLIKGRLAESEQALQAAKEDCANIRGQLHDTQTTLGETRAARQQLEAALRTSEAGLRSVTRGSETLDEKLQSARAERKTLQAQIAVLERENARLIEQRQALEHELSSVRTDSRSAEAALVSVKRAFGEVRVALAEAKSRARRRGGDE